MQSCVEIKHKIRLSILLLNCDGSAEKVLIGFVYILNKLVDANVEESILTSQLTNTYSDILEKFDQMLYQVHYFLVNETARANKISECNIVKAFRHISSNYEQISEKQWSNSLVIEIPMFQYI